MAVDRFGNTMATGQVVLVAGTVRRIDGDSVLVVIGIDDKVQAIRVNDADVIKVDDIQPKNASLTAIAALSPNTGDLMYYNGSQWRGLGVGNDGDVLKVSGGVPVWEAP